MVPPEPDSDQKGDPEQQGNLEQQGDSSSGTLEQRVTAPLIPYAQLPELVAYAHSLHQFDRMREDQATIDSFSRQLLPYQREEGLTPAEICEIARGVGIPQQYMERALSIRHPSIEQQLGDLNSHGAAPSGDLLKKMYQKGIREALRSALPRDLWVEKPYYGYNDSIEFYQIVPRDSKRKFLVWEWVTKKKEKRLMADLQLCSGSGWININLQVYHPLFLRACGEAIKELNQKMGKYLHKYTVVNHYEVK